MIPLLPRWNLHQNRPTFYDTDSVTMLELAGRMHGSMNELITDYNSFVDNVNKIITEFVNNTEKKNEVFETALRQEFQDFIDIVDLKLKEDVLKHLTNGVKAEWKYDENNEELILVLKGE